VTTDNAILTSGKRTKVGFPVHDAIVGSTL
jgi:hypothetical protein